MEEGSSGSVHPTTSMYHPTSGHSVTGKEQLCSSLLPWGSWVASEQQQAVRLEMQQTSQRRRRSTLMGKPLRTMAPEDAQGACQLPHSSGVHILPMHTDLWISHMPYWNTLLSKASSSLAVILSTEVALDKSHHRRQNPRAQPAQQYKATMWLLVYTCQPSGLPRLTWEVPQKFMSMVNNFKQGFNSKQTTDPGTQEKAEPKLTR